MPIKSDFSRLDKLKKNLNELGNTSKVAFVDLLSADFLSSCSSFSSFEEFMNATGFKVESSEDFDAIPQNDMDQFVSKNTTYSNWTELLQAAAGEYAKKQLFKGL